jgi:tetratricopeptide (TPR) repeat protein
LSYSNRGIVFSKTGRDKEAIEDFTKALSLNPHFVRGYLDRGGYYEKSGNRGLALRDYEKACDMGSEAGCEALRSYGQR